MPPLREHDVDRDPLVQFLRWLDEARSAGIDLAEAAALATATVDAAPSVRMVLVKAADERGLTFFTSYESRKARDLAANPRAALLLYWHALGRQVRAEGAVERIPDAESDEYFAARPPGSRVSAAASPQSWVVDSRDVLEARAADVRRRYGDAPPRPPSWGGYRLVPDAWELWQHRDDRLHDRLRYRRTRRGWVLERLAP